MPESAMRCQRSPSETASAAAEPLLPLVYRYLWPFAYFRDVSQGKRMERQLNYRHNRAMRAHLPGFAVKWAVLTALCFGFGMLLGSLSMPVLLTACLFATGSWTLSVAVVVLTAWLWLARFPDLG
jgi:hypothetical protein